MDAETPNPLVLFFGLVAFVINVQFLVPWVSIPALLGGLVSIALGSKPEGSPIPRWCYLPFTIPIAMLLCGVAFYWEYWPSDAIAWNGIVLLWTLLLLNLPMSVCLIIMLKGRRLFATGLSVVQCWISFSTFAVAGMAVSGIGL